LKRSIKSHAVVEKVSEGKLIAEEMYQHFLDEHRKLMHGLKKAEAKAADYFHQLSFASRVRDAVWPMDCILGLRLFRTWWIDPAQRIDLNSVNIEDILCTSEAIRRLLSFGVEEMPDTAGINEFDYQPPAAATEVAGSGAGGEVFEAVEAGVGLETAEGGEVKEAPQIAEAAPGLPDPLRLFRGTSRLFI
jgi:hypothetical protein